ARRVAAALGKAAFIEHQHGQGRTALLLPGQRWAQALDDQGAQLIAAGVLIPHSSREQALDAIRAGLPGLFSDLPAIFARDVAQHGLQVAQRVLMGLWAREVGTQPGMHLAQVVVPPADFTQAGPGLRSYGMLGGLHAALLSEGRDNA